MAEDKKEEKVVDEKRVGIIVSDHYECPVSRAHYCDFKNSKNGFCPVCGAHIIYVE